MFIKHAAKCMIIAVTFMVSVAYAGTTGDTSSIITHVNPFTSPSLFYKKHPDKVGMVPDGTGLQVFYYDKSNQHYYLIGGPRTGRLMSVNGGKVEHPEASFLKQLKEEYDEETFGTLIIQKIGQSTFLKIGQHRYPLNIQSNLSHITERPGQFAYVTFTATIDDLTVNQVQQIANHMSPTAIFYEKLGSFLYPHVRSAPKDDGFEAYWQQQQADLNRLLDEETKLYDDLMQDGLLLITPQQAFNTSTLEGAWEELRGIKTYAELKNHFQNTVGRYSERKGYYVFDAEKLLNDANQNSTEIRDIHGHVVASGFFNGDVIKNITPLILNQHKRAA